MTTTYRRSGGLAVLVAVAAIGLAACGGGPASSSSVASLGTTTTTSGNGGADGSRSTPTTLSQSNPTQLLDEWAACMRTRGDPNQADPTIDTNKVIHISWDPSIPGGYNGTNKGGQGNSGPGQYCRAYLTEAQTVLQGGQPQKQPDPSQLLKFSECMQANGIPDFPDPTGDNLSINRGAGGDLNPNIPIFQNASKVCAEKTGVQGFGGTPPPGTIELDSSAVAGG